MLKFGWWGYDIHVHCRDEEQCDKATIASTLELSHSQGVQVICDEPNHTRPVTNRERVTERLALVPKGEEKSYLIWLGLTGDQQQLTEGLWCYNNKREVVGFKVFLCLGQGELSITDDSLLRGHLTRIGTSFLPWSPRSSLRG